MPSTALTTVSWLVIVLASMTSIAIVIDIRQSREHPRRAWGRKRAGANSLLHA